MPEDTRSTPIPPIKIFFSYSHRDEGLRDELSKALSALKREGAIVEWYDRMIGAGERWAEKIAGQIEEAQIILLLISQDFMASDYCHEIEMKRALERERDGEAVVIPVILRACDWKGSPFEHLDALPTDALAVTSWKNQDEAFVNVALGIRKVAEGLRGKADSPARPSTSIRPPRLDAEQFEKARLRRDLEEMKTANPYLLGDAFVGRKRELKDLQNWLAGDAHRVFCICDLGGTGKSALVWHWLNDRATREALVARGIRQYWCSFYARNFSAMQFLHELAAKLGVVMDATSAEAPQRQLQRLILDRLRREKWLLVLDGLEREMGAFAARDQLWKDSEEQDCRNEKGDVWRDEREIRDYVFSDFLRALLSTHTKVLITSRLFPDDLAGPDGAPLPEVIHYPFEPMPPENAEEVWNLFGEPDGSPFQREFFELVGFHPQVISVVAAATKEASARLQDWFNEFSEPKRQVCLNRSSLLTERRHRWLEQATRDLALHRRDAWLTLCYIVRHSEASDVDELMDDLVNGGAPEEARPGRFQTEVKLRDELEYLVRRRLVGIGLSAEEEKVDVHPVIRGMVWDHIQSQYARGGDEARELARHLESDGSRELRLRLLDLPELDERLPALAALDDSDEPHDFLGVLSTFFPPPQPGRLAWLDGLPALHLRKDQAWLLYRTGNELMRRGRWDESAPVFDRAILAYELCGDRQSVEECRRSHDWQSLYGGNLLQTEREQIAMLKKGKRKSTPYWLALLLAIRQSEHAAPLLQSLPAETNRWTLQTVGEAWFYLDEYERAYDLTRRAWDRQGEEKDSVAQALWEAVTMGLALLRLDRLDEAEIHLNFAKTRGTGWAYNLVPMFAYAGFIELEYRRARKLPPGRTQLVALNNADHVFKQYGKADRDDSFQIPAAEAHLAMARVHHTRGDAAEALDLARRALRVAGEATPPFQYASVVRRATEFLTRDLGQPEPPAVTPDFEAIEHEKAVAQAVQLARRSR
jgi:tetratricopeptide (TPR) repeat protein